MDRVKDKVAIVTGGAGGLGRAEAALLAGEGAQVVITDIDECTIKKAAAEINEKNGRCIGIQHDVTSESDWDRVIKKTLDEFGRLDVLVNNAGVIFYKKIEDTSLAEWRRLMNVNLDGVFLGVKFAIETMKKTKGGSIINISSVAALIGNPDAAAYHASKGGVRSFTKAAAIECSQAGYGYNIRVNSIHPGVIDTAMGGRPETRRNKI